MMLAYNVMSNKGFSLVEMMIALLILAFSLLGFLGAITASIDVNLRNEARNKGIGLTTQIVETLIVQDFDSLTQNISPCNPLTKTNSCILDKTNYSALNSCLVGNTYLEYPDPTLGFNVRGFMQDYSFAWCITDLNTSLKQINIVVDYTYRGETFNYESVIYKHKDK